VTRSAKTKGAVLAGAVSLAVGLLMALEGNPGKPYVDIAGVLTDCYGNTKNVHRSWVRSEAECKALLGGEAVRIGTFVQRDAPEIPESTLAGVISWTYNVGDGAYRSSTLRRHLLAQDWVGACYQMHRWVYITDPGTGEKIQARGLKNRRDKEVQICLADLVD